MIVVLEWTVLTLFVGAAGLVVIGAFLYLAGQLSFPMNVITAAQHTDAQPKQRN